MTPSKKPAAKSASSEDDHDIDLGSDDIDLGETDVQLDDDTVDLNDSDHPIDEISPLPGSLDEDPGPIAKAEIKQKADAERTDVDLLNDHAFYTAIVFQTSGQLEEFIRKTGWKLESEYWIDGFKLAKQLKIDIKPIPGFAAKRRLHDSREIPKAQREVINRGLSFV